MSEVLAGTSFGQSGNDVAGFETGHWADVFPDEFHALFSHCFGAMSRKVLGLDSDKCDRDFSFYLIVGADDDSLCDFAVFHQDFLHLASRKTMTCSVNHIIFSSHDVKVPIFIEIS